MDLVWIVAFVALRACTAALAYRFVAQPSNTVSEFPWRG